MLFLFLSAFSAVNCEELTTIRINGHYSNDKYKVISEQADSYKRFDFDASLIEHAIFIGFGKTADPNEKHIEITLGGRGGRLSYIMETTGQTGSHFVAMKEYVYLEHSKRYFDAIKSSITVILDNGRVEVLGAGKKFMEWKSPEWFDKYEYKTLMAHGWCCSGILKTEGTKPDKCPSRLDVSGVNIPEDSSAADYPGSYVLIQGPHSRPYYQNTENDMKIYYNNFFIRQGWIFNRWMDSEGELVAEGTDDCPPIVGWKDLDNGNPYEFFVTKASQPMCPHELQVTGDTFRIPSGAWEEAIPGTYKIYEDVISDDHQVYKNQRTNMLIYFNRAQGWMFNKHLDSEGGLVARGLDDCPPKYKWTDLDGGNPYEFAVYYGQEILSKSS